MSIFKSINQFNIFINKISSSLKNGHNIEIRGFGTFSVSHRAATKGRNPRTGEAIQIAASKNAKFKSGKGLKDAVN